MSPLRIEPDDALMPAGWCWCGHNWLIRGIDEFAEAGLLHSRGGCWPRDRATRTLGLPHALETTWSCCGHCPCTGMDHAVPCPVDGCDEGQGGR